MKIKNYTFNQHVVLALIAGLVYFRSLFFGFTYLDDNVLILDNLFFLRNIGNIFKVFTLEVFHVLHASAAYYRPILTLSLMVDSWISGESPFFYHVTNLLLHIGSTSALFYLLKNLKVNVQLAFFFAMVFAIHPALAQAVAWIPGRNDTLIALFTFLTFIFYLKFWEDSTGKYFWWHLVFFGLALFTKESAIFIPSTLLFYSVILKKEKLISNKTFTFLAFWGGIFGIWFLLRGIALGNSRVSYNLFETVHGIVKNTPAVFLFLGKVFLPINLSTLPILTNAQLVYGIGSLVSLLLLLVLSKPNWRMVIFGLWLYLTFLLPSFIRPSNDYMADFLEHRQYLPLLGLFLILAEIKWLRNFNLNINKYLFPSIGVVIFLIIINFFHLGNFADGISYWTNAVKTSPSHPLAQKNLGSMYFFAKDYGEAEKRYQEALHLNPQETMVHNNIGLIYMYQDKFLESEKEFQEELKINPTYDNAHFNLGLLYYRTDKKEEAERMWLKTLTVNPDYLDAYRALTIYYSEIKDDNKAGYFLHEGTKRGLKL